MKLTAGLGTITRRLILMVLLAAASIGLLFILPLFPPPANALWLPLVFAGLVAMIALEAKWTRAHGPNPLAKPAKSDLYMGVLLAAIAVAGGFVLFMYLWSQNANHIGI